MSRICRAQQRSVIRSYCGGLASPSSASPHSRARYPTNCCAGSASASLSVLEESHLDASELHDIVVVEPPCLRSDGNAVDQRIVVFLFAVDMHDVIPFGAARDGGDLDTRTAQCRQCLDQLELASRERTA